VNDCPPTPSATQSLLERIAFIQKTHYGGFWDFASSSTPTDTAYTNQPLAVHNDTTYLSHPCGLQMFHLLSHTEGSGGESLFVDGYAAATHLLATEPSHYHTLHTQKVHSHASGNREVGELQNNLVGLGGIQVLSGEVLREMGRFEKGMSPSDTRYKLKRTITPTAIRWNNEDRDIHTFQSLNSLERWYRAAREWTKILKMKQFEMKVQLKPGQPIIFDNWRYLHGRTGFSGKRRICGGYSESYVPRAAPEQTAFLLVSIYFAVMALSESTQYLRDHATATAVVALLPPHLVSRAPMLYTRTHCPLQYHYLQHHHTLTELLSQHG
jgi:trimethyllysine dioxygenase